MMNLSYPSNASFFANAIISVLNVDVLSPDILNNWLFNFESDNRLMDILNEPNSNYTDKNILIPTIKEMGFNSYNVVLNLQGLFMVFIFIFIEYLILALGLLAQFFIKRKLQQYEGGEEIWKYKIRPHLKKLKKSMLFKQPILVVLEAVLQITMAGMLGWFKP